MYICKKETNMKWFKKYLTVYNKPFTSEQYALCDDIKKRITSLASAEPVVSICIIAHNEEKHLLASLWTISDMLCKYPVEIIGVDNNSTDKTTDIFEKCGITYYKEMRAGQGFARNCGLSHAKGKYHICIDSDSLYPSKYAEIYVETLAKENVVGCYGLWSFIPDKNHPSYQLHLYEFLRDIYLKIQDGKRPELNVRGMTFAFRTDLGKKIGFRTDIKRGEDGSLALALKKYGKIKFLTGKRTRIITDNGTMNSDGSMLQSFFKRLKKATKSGLSIFHTKQVYQDEDSNLIK